jgi:hypothetical protein
VGTVVGVQVFLSAANGDPAIPAEVPIQPDRPETGKQDARRRKAVEMTSSDLVSDAPSTSMDGDGFG